MKPINMTVFLFACESVFFTKSGAKEPERKQSPATESGAQNQKWNR